MNTITRIISFYLLAACLASVAQAMEWQKLDAMRVSIQELNYRGEFLHRRGDKTSVYSIVHQYSDGQSTELLKQLDGGMMEVFRQGLKVTCYFPKTADHLMDQAVPAAPFSQVDSLDLNQIARNYRAVSVGEARVAGYQAQVIELQGDQWRYRQRLWLEAKTNLLLQSEIIAPDGRILEQFRYTRLELNVSLSEADLTPSLQGDANALTQTATQQRIDYTSDAGFISQLSWLPSGYVLTHSEQAVQTKGWREQRTYSDGLTSFTVFAEQGKSSATASAKMGATTAVVTSVDDVSITLIGEIPNATAKQIAGALLIDGATL